MYMSLGLVATLSCDNTGNNSDKKGLEKDSSVNIIIPAESIDKALPELPIQDDSLAIKFKNIYESEDKEAANLNFKTAFSQALSDESAFDYDFPKTQEAGLELIKSKDNKVKIYNWDNNTGGTMRSFTATIQVKEKDVVKTIWKEVENAETDDYIPKYTALDILDKGTETIYITSYRYITSTKNLIDGVKTYILKNNELSPINIIKFKNGQTSHELERAYELTDQDFKYFLYFDTQTNSIKETLTNKKENPTTAVRTFSWKNNFLMEK